MESWTEHLREAIRLSDDDKRLLTSVAVFQDESQRPSRYLAVDPHEYLHAHAPAPSPRPPLSVHGLPKPAWVELIVKAGRELDDRSSGWMGPIRRCLRHCRSITTAVSPPVSVVVRANRRRWSGTVPGVAYRRRRRRDLIRPTTPTLSTAIVAGSGVGVPPPPIDAPASFSRST